MKQMNEVKTSNKRFFIYPGRDMDYNYRAIPLGNTVIQGGVGSGKSVLLEQIVVKLLQEYSPQDISIRVWDRFGFLVDIWTPMKQGKPDTERVVPHFNLCAKGNCHSDEESLESFKSFLDAVYDIYQERVKLLKNNGYECIEEAGSIKREIIILDEPCLFSEQHYIDMLKQSEKYGIYFIIASQAGCITTETLNACKHRLCLRCQEKVSELMLNCNIASRIQEPRGNCYYWFKDSRVSPELLYIPFTPNTVIKKIVGAYSQRLKSVVDLSSETEFVNVREAGEAVLKLLHQGKVVKCDGNHEIKSVVAAIMAVEHSYNNYKFLSSCKNSTEELMYLYCKDGNLGYYKEDEIEDIRNVVQARELRVSMY